MILRRILHIQKLKNPRFRRDFSQKVYPPEKIRNIGIIAHVDAGKTTVTERLLYLAGAISFAGNVDNGNTVTDFLDIERERGITVQSAAVNLDWAGHRINLIDTPGHVDFRVEVERCVRVLDGIVCIIDASAGVQPQTLTVWSQSSKFKLPAHFFINKLDKKEANFEKSIDSIEQKLGVKAVKTVVPYENGLLDVIAKKVYKNPENSRKTDEEWCEIQKSTREHEILEEARSELCYSIADQNEEFMAEFLDKFQGEHEKISDQTVIEHLRNLTLSSKIATVSCGSAIRSLHCVRPILDGVVNFFPSPDLRNRLFQQVFGEDLSGLVFKITHDKRRGQLSYMRIYTGRLSNNSHVFNSSQLASEGPIKVFTPYADELKPVEHMEHGNIAVVSGLHNTVTGDTVLQSREAGEKAHKVLLDLKDETLLQSRENSVVFSGIEAPEAVFFCCIEPPSNRQQNLFNKALDELTREDPSMRIRFDRDTGQTIVETQGELHLEAIKDRLKRGYGLDVFIGALQVAYREMLTEPITHTTKVEDLMSEKKRPESVEITMVLEPTDGHVPFKKIELDLPQTARLPRPDWQKAINEGCSNALQNGPLVSFPVHAVRVVLTELVASGGKINPAL
uniref:Tr-type G domain-containing protein n=1 Tax=Caenorhabditis japonica TaxID=281687 RepID=A0A8R1DSF7_CAEJA